MCPIQAPSPTSDQRHETLQTPRLEQAGPTNQKTCPVPPGAGTLVLPKGLLVLYSWGIIVRRPLMSRYFRHMNSILDEVGIEYPVGVTYT